MSGSVAEEVRGEVERSQGPGFVRASDFAGPVGAVEAELRRLTSAGALRRVRKGLYWSGPRTALGVGAPDPGQVALEVAGHGAGPAGAEAARWLGLTTQVPGRPAFAVPGRVPSPVPGVRFTARTPHRREFGLRPLEVAVIEVLRDYPAHVEADWADVVAAIAELADKGRVRPAVIDTDVGSEYHVGLRERWAEVADALGASV